MLHDWVLFCRLCSPREYFSRSIFAEFYGLRYACWEKREGCHEGVQTSIHRGPKRRETRHDRFQWSFRGPNSLVFRKKCFWYRFGSWTNQSLRFWAKYEKLVRFPASYLNGWWEAFWNGDTEWLWWCPSFALKLRLQKKTFFSSIFRKGYLVLRVPWAWKCIQDLRRQRIAWLYLGDRKTWVFKFRFIVGVVVWAWSVGFWKVLWGRIWGTGLWCGPSILFRKIQLR